MGPGDGLNRREYLVPTGIRRFPDCAARSKSSTCYCHFQMEGFLTWHRDVPMWREEPHISYDNIPLTCFATAQYEGGSEMTWLLTVSPWPMPALGSRKFNAQLSSVTTRSRVTSVTRENTLYRRYALRCGLSLQKNASLSLNGMNRTVFAMDTHCVICDGVTQPVYWSGYGLDNRPML